MLKKEYRRTGDRFATFNDYPSAFDPQNPADFCYLITVIIRKGSPEIFELLDEIFEPLGKVADRDRAQGSLHHMITVLLVTKRGSFVHYAQVLLQGNVRMFVDFEFVELAPHAMLHLLLFGTRE